MCRWNMAKHRTIGEKRASFDYSPWFHAEPFVLDFEWRGNINIELPDQWRLLVCGQLSYLCFVQRIFDWGERSGFGWRGRWRDWRKIAPKYVKKKSWFQNKYWGTLTNWIWPILLSKHSTNLLTPQPHFLFFKASLPA